MEFLHYRLKYRGRVGGGLVMTKCGDEIFLTKSDIFIEHLAFSFELRSDLVSDIEEVINIGTKYITKDLNTNHGIINVVSVIYHGLGQT